MQERSRSPAPTTPRLVDATREGEQAGSLVPFSGVRCPTKGCRNKLAESLAGTATFYCRKCRQSVTITK